MKVYGIEITQAQIDACIARMKSHTFQCRDLIEVLKQNGAEYKVRTRAADRIIQRESNAGRIAFNDERRWRWIEQA